MHRPKFLMSQLHVSGGSSNVKKKQYASQMSRSSNLLLCFMHWIRMQWSYFHGF